jgi:uncharacterized membrane protein YcjF (UPF0283 family)
MDKEFDNNGRLGDPLDGRQGPKASKQPSDSRHREGDSGLGRPDPVPEDVREVSEQERREYHKQLEEKLRDEFEQKLKDLQQFNHSWELPRGIKKLAGWILFFFAAFLGVFVVNQAVIFMANIDRLTEPYKSVAMGAMVFFSVILAFIVISLLWFALRMKRLKPFDIRPLTTLQQRADMQRFAREKENEARKLFVDYLKSYSLNKKGVRSLLGAGLRSDEIEKLSRVRDKLTDKNSPLPARQWFEQFADGWQRILDKAVDRRIKEYAVKTGLGTAASPIAFVDQMVVMYSCFAMLKDILKIYNLRPAFGQTAVILSRSIINIYLSGMLENAAENSADNMADYISEHFGKIAGTFGKTAGAKAAEGAINGFLIFNLGRRAKKMLQPMVGAADKS